MNRFLIIGLLVVIAAGVSVVAWNGMREHQEKVQAITDQKQSDIDQVKASQKISEDANKFSEEFIKKHP